MTRSCCFYRMKHNPLMFGVVLGGFLQEVRLGSKFEACKLKNGRINMGKKVADLSVSKVGTRCPKAEVRWRALEMCCC